MNWQLAAFFLLAGITLYSAYRVIVDETVTHAALYLAVAFVGIAGFYLLLGGEFLAAVQVLVYAGAVMTVMVFAIMLSDMRDIRGVKLPLVGRLTSPHWGVLPGAIAVSLALLLLAAFANSALLPGPEGRPATLAELAKGLLTTYLVPFEVASVLLLAAMVGAIILNKREDEQ